MVAFVSGFLTQQDTPEYQQWFHDEVQRILRESVKERMWQKQTYGN